MTNRTRQEAAEAVAAELRAMRDEMGDEAFADCMEMLAIQQRKRGRHRIADACIELAMAYRGRDAKALPMRPPAPSPGNVSPMTAH